MKHQCDYDKLLVSYFSGKLTKDEKQTVDEWKHISVENKIIFENAKKVWQSLNLLQEMKGYDSVSALLKINEKIGQVSRSIQPRFLFYWQRVAAVLLVPLLIIGGIYFWNNNQTLGNQIVWQTITTPPGVKTQVQLPDGTMVWLNSESSLRYPSSFVSNERNVRLKGEAFFEVTKDESHPFLVDLGKIEVEVVGTKFNVVNDDTEKQTEVVLTTGKVKLFKKQEDKKQMIAEMLPGQLAVYQKNENKLSLKYVDTEKYVCWIDGQLIFRDDAMDEVIRKLDRWFNVEIEMADPEITQYVYTATFRNETIDQILDLLRRTSPIEYSITPPKRLNDGSFEKQKIVLKKK